MSQYCKKTVRNHRPLIRHSGLVKFENKHCDNKSAANEFTFLLAGLRSRLLVPSHRRATWSRAKHTESSCGGRREEKMSDCAGCDSRPGFPTDTLRPAARSARYRGAIWWSVCCRVYRHVRPCCRWIVERSMAVLCPVPRESEIAMWLICQSFNRCCIRASMLSDCFPYYGIYFVCS